MSQQQWPAPTRSPGGGGSVRRAREMAEAGLTPQMPSQIPRAPPQRPYDQSRVAPNAPTPRMRPPMPPALVSTKSGQGPIGVAISRPTQVPQWPLAATIEGGPDPQYQPPPGRGVPPQRPPRPSHVPSMLDASRLQDPTPSFQYIPQQGQNRGYEEDDVISPIVASPMTQSSRPSTLSSVGSIPDFPVPMPNSGPPRRSANLGPPPSSRRGASSYYSQASFVSPIPEESPRTVPSHQSYASSAAMPTSWGSDSPRYDEDDYEDEEVYDGDSPDFRRVERGFGSPIEEGRESRESNGDDSDDRGLIRSASFGRRAKPSMITTRSSDKVEPAVRPQVVPQQMSKLEKMGVIAGVGGPTTGLVASKNGENGQRETVWPIIGNVNSPLATGTGFIDKSSTSSEETVPTIARAVTTNEAAPAYVANRSDPKAAEMLGAYNAASALQPGPSPTRTPSPGFSRLSAIRRPPRLDMDAVRDAEARGSLTSLPDLIRRATRLAAMMDRGKRPASRMALNDWPSDNDLAKDKEIGLSEDEKHKSGLSGMLAAFPPPGVATPVRGGTPVRPVSSWPSPYDPSAGVGQDSGRSKKKRRCCGLPCWGFLIVLLILLIIIAAAVVVPLELLVFHKPKSTSAATATTSALQQCEANTATACKNGGTSVIDDGSCACICTNGFTGTTCTTANATGCTTTSLSGSNLTNVTLGDAITRLISDAQSNFSIPLSESTIIARFNNANLTCASENALVTFQGSAMRRRGDTTSSAAWSIATSDGIIYDSSSSYYHPSSTSSPSSSSTTTTSSSASTTTTNPTDVFNITTTVLDFSRVAVLYILQQEQLNAAITAQSALQKFFEVQAFTNMAARNISLGNGNVVDLISLTVNVGNGTVGGMGNSSSSSSTGSKKRWEGREEAQLPRRRIELYGGL
ncbi:uncharacterized protein LY89DRAFT_736690 [Mollisia scopiformis]|uniref:EGF-like domain-containing protein n=1 Tax=Mollisia scopiformis TaxID=149040 RepID=A0A194X0G7_MOLSC|nr:uncharacterized protein LY89DRAFT_736690 [Mollisia scopiformis]KUJ13685.1 hypothetical protein LY89DRAFT_736690 [Mollisia scopiformis]